MRNLSKMVIFIQIFSSFIAFPDLARPDSRNTSYERASVLIDKGQYRQALGAYALFLKEESSPLDSRLPKVYNNMGFCHFKLNRFDEALEYFHKALALRVEFPNCLNNIAVIFMNKSQYEGAIPFLKKALLLDNFNVKVVFNLFVCYARQKNEETARGYLKHAFVLNTTYTCGRLKNKGVSERQLRRIQDGLFPAKND